MKKILLFFYFLSFLCYAKIPKRAVSTAQFTTEILLSIGAESQMAGTAFMDNEILPELKEKFEKIPVLSKKYPSKELFYSVEPDFLIGWAGAADPKNLGSLEELNNNGIEFFLMKSLKSNNLEVLFEDIERLGKIFDLEKNANRLTGEMRGELKTVQLSLPKEKIKIFSYDSGDGAPMVIGGGGLGNTIIEMAGGYNIFCDTPGSFAVGNWERVLAEDPDMVLIVNYGDISAEKKIKFLKETSPIKNLNAVKNNRFTIIDLEDISPGVRNVKAIKKLAEVFHGKDI